MANPDNFDTRGERVQKLSSLPRTSFAEYFREMMKVLDFTSKRLVDESKLTNETVAHLRSGQGRPKINTVLSALIAMKVPPLEAKDALSLAGHDFIAGDKVHRHYRTLVQHYFEKSIDECNDILRAKGVRDSDLLGQVKGSKLSEDTDINKDKE